MVVDLQQSVTSRILGVLIPERFRKFAPKRLHKYFPESRSKKFARLCIQIGTVLLIGGGILFTIVESLLYVSALQRFELSQAERHAQRARPLVQLLTTLTFHSVPDLEVWNDGLFLGSQLGELQDIAKTLSRSLSQTEQPSSLTPIIPILSQLSSTTHKLAVSIEQSYLAKRMISAERRAALTQANEVLSQLDPLTETLLRDKQTWVVVFQNSDELRATGGFAGSYALVTLQDGVLQEIIIEDIYDADGQFTGYLAAPAGVREYTSSSRGLRLPDANWYPHFPESAQKMLQFFALGNRQDIKGIVTVNLSVAEALVRITGPLTIPDYPTVITAENIHTVLREERGQFFPGSIQKKHILSQVMTVLRQKLGELSAAQQVAVFSELLNHARRKEIQIFALNPDLQDTLSQYGVTGEVGMNALQAKQFAQSCGALCNLSPTIFYLVESNVGINKANRFIRRSVKISDAEDVLKVQIELQNTAAKEEKTLLTPIVGSTTNPLTRIATNGYANYQRLLLSPNFSVREVLIDGEKVEKVAFESLVIKDVKVDQYGFLVIVLPAQTVTVELVLEPTQAAAKLTYFPLFIQKQSGLTPPAYTLNFATYRETFILENDRLITWQ